MRPIRLFILLFLFCGIAPAFSQEALPADTLVYQRKLFHSVIYQNGVPITKSRFAGYLTPSAKWNRKNQIANIILPAGPVISAGGIYLAYDAIKGEPKVAAIDGKEYPYVVRSLPKLLGGLALFVTGLSMVESANETKMNATRWFNEEHIKKYQAKKTALHWGIGLSSEGSPAVTLNF